MGYGDYIPSGGHHSKKPLTKAQIRKLQEAYKKADSISEEVRKQEQIDSERVQAELEDTLKIL